MFFKLHFRSFVFSLVLLVALVLLTTTLVVAQNNQSKTKHDVANMSLNREVIEPPVTHSSRLQEAHMDEYSDSHNVEFAGEIEGNAWYVTVAGAHAYAASKHYDPVDTSGLRIIDATDPTTLLEVGFYQSPGWAGEVAIAGNYAYLTDYIPDSLSSMLRIIDVSNPMVPVEVGFDEIPGYPRVVAVAGRYAYVAGYEFLQIFNVANPSDPYEVGFLELPDGVGFKDLAVAGDYIYAAKGSDDVQYDGLQIIDVANPADPIEKGFISMQADAVDVSGQYAYVAAGSDGLRIVNISDPENPAESGFHKPPEAVGHVAIAGSFAYIADWQNGVLRVIDVSDPADPRETGNYDTGDIVSGLAAAQNYAYVAKDQDGLQVLRYTGPNHYFVYLPGVLQKK